MGQDFRRMTDKAREPTEEEMLSFIGEPAKEAWLEIRQFLEDRYDFVPETIFYGAKYGWTIRYRKDGKTLCSLFPEKRWIYSSDSSWQERIRKSSFNTR